MKKAIVLLMTIGFIAIISALVMVSISISKKSFDQVTYIDARNQFSVVFKDFVNILRANSKKIKKAEDLETFLLFSMPPMKEPKSEVEIGFLLESQMGKLNINYILDRIDKDKGDENSTYLSEPLIRYFSMFKLKEPQMLLDILNDTYDKDDIERGAYSEIANIDFDFSQGKIYSFRHLNKIFDQYFKVSRDPNIFNINKEAWEEVFYYGDTNKSRQLLDCNQLENTSTIGLLTNNKFQDGSMVNYCDVFKNPQDYDLKNLKDIYTIKDFNKTNYLIKCDIIFNTENFNQNISFNYDIKNGEISNIDRSIQE
jgi:hypothetical protein